MSLSILDLDQTSLVIIINVLSSMIDNSGIYADENIAFSHLETAMYSLHFNVCNLGINDFCGSAQASFFLELDFTKSSRGY